jgi:short-subunit dehydrogenase
MIRRNHDGFEGTVGIITGGGTGIGRSIALALARLRVAVVVAGRRPEPLAETVRMVEGRDGRGLAVPTDLAESEDIENLVRATVSRFGRIDHVINNAVMNYGGPYDRVPVEEIQHMIAVSFTAPLILSRLALPQMRERRSGSIAMIGSTAYVGWPEVVTYSAIKAGLDSFAQGLRREVTSDGVHVTVVHAAGTDTPSMTPQARRAFVALGFKIYSPGFVAGVVIDAIRRKRPRVVIGSWEKRHVWRSRIDPRLVDRQLAKMRHGFQAAMLDHKTPC